MNTSAQKSLYQMNPQSRFSDRAEDYAKYRPSYPTEAIALILEGLEKSPELIVADIGAGTGISSRLLADRGIKVIAIEPNAAMREVAIPHPLVEFTDGNAENTNLPDASVDLVTCFQSFHWFNPKPTLTEFKRILKPQGKLAAVWNNRNQEDEFTGKYSNLNRIASGDRSQLRYGTERFLSSSYLFSQVNHFIFPFQQALDRDGLIGRAMSTSYIPKKGEVYQQFVSDLKRLYEEYRDRNGLVYLKYITNIYLAQVQTQYQYP